MRPLKLALLGLLIVGLSCAATSAAASATAFPELGIPSSGSGFSDYSDCMILGRIYYGPECYFVETVCFAIHGDYCPW